MIDVTLLHRAYVLLDMQLQNVSIYDYKEYWPRPQGGTQ